MSMFRAVRRRLGLKFLLSYFVVILVGVAVLALASALTVPAAFDRHLAAMGSMMGDMGMSLESDLFVGYRAAAAEALTWAAGAATAAAVILSILISRRVVDPVRQMMTASRRIADGHFDERVPLGRVAPEDMDELEQLAVSLNQLASKLERIEAVRRQLIADVAHELRTPLSIVRGSLEGLMDGVLPADEETLLGLQAETGRLQRLVEDLQELSRAEARAFALEIRAVDPRHMVEVAVERLARQFEEKGVTLRSEVPPALPRVRADEERAGQVLLNILGNALQYTPSGRGVTIRAGEAGGRVEIEVIDEGIGIAADQLPQVFTRFYRVDRSRSRAGGGSGIGLTIAQHLAEAQGGSLRAESPGLGKGSRFVFALPVAS